MSDPSLFRLRVFYVKRGRLALLSHLEVAHALERAVRRANLPFAVSQGFSPHMRISYGTALPVGVAGEQEIFEVLLTTYLAPQKALCALREKSVPDLAPYECEYVEHNAPSASVCFPFSDYQVCLNSSLLDIQVPETIQVVRKKKEKTLLVHDFLHGDVLCSENTLTFTLETKPTGSLRPDVFVRACLDYTNVACEVQSITRTSQHSMKATQQ